MNTMPQEPAPTTGNPDIDAAMAAVAAAEDLELSEQVPRLAEAQRVLAEVLRSSRAGDQTVGS